jgi:hypothetical protein
MADVFKEASEQFKARQLTIDNYHKAIVAERKLADQEKKAAEQQSSRQRRLKPMLRRPGYRLKERQHRGMEEAAEQFVHMLLGEVGVMVKVMAKVT